MKIFDKMERLYNHQKRLIELHKEIEAWTKSLVKIENELDKG